MDGFEVEAALRDQDARLDRVSRNAADLKRRLEEGEFSHNDDDYRNGPRDGSTSSFVRPEDGNGGWGTVASNSQPESAAPGFSSGGEGSSFGVGGPNDLSAAQSKKVMLASLGRGLDTPLKVNVADDGSISFERKDGEKYKRNWFWKSTSDHQEMNALENKRRELKNSFDNSNDSNEMNGHLENWMKVNNALRERANRLKDNKSWFGGYTSKAKEAQRLLQVSGGDESYADGKLRARQEQDKQAVQAARLKKRNSLEDDRERVYNQNQGTKNWFGQRVAPKEKFSRSPMPVDFRLDDEPGADRLRPDVLQDQPRTEVGDPGVPGKRSRGQLANKYLSPEAQARIAAKKRNGKGGLLGQSAEMADNAQGSNPAGDNGSGLSERGQAAQRRLEKNGDLGGALSDRTGRIQEVGRSGQALNDNAGDFRDEAGNLERYYRNKKWWQW